MMNRTNARRQLEIVDMLIRALAEEMALQRTQNNDRTSSRVPVEMEEALYKLRLQKLAISAFLNSGRGAGSAARH